MIFPHNSNFFPPSVISLSFLASFYSPLRFVASQAGQDGHVTITIMKGKSWCEDGLAGSCFGSVALARCVVICFVRLWVIRVDHTGDVSCVFKLHLI